MKRVCVVGGGISGLAAAWRVQERVPEAELVILEASDRAGGKIQTIRGHNCVLEAGAWWLDAAAMLPLSRWLRKDLDLEDQILPAGRLNSFIYKDGDLRTRSVSPPFPFPLDPEAIAASGLLSEAGVKRVADEPGVPPGENDEERVGAFFERRLGAEYEVMLLSPWFQSVFMARPSEVSMRAVFPQLIEIERRFKSLTRACEKAAKLGRFIPATALAQMQPSKVLKSWLSRDPLSRLGSPRIALRYGLSEITASLSERLRVDVSTNEMAKRLVRTDRGWLVITPHRRVYCDTVVLAVPAHVAGKLLAAEFPDVASRIATMACASGAVVNLVLGKNSQGAAALKGREILVPLQEGGLLRSVQCVSDRLGDWAGGDCVLIRIAAGPLPTLMPTKEQILADCLEDLRDKLGVEIKPEFTHIQPFPHSYPVYGPGHCGLVTDIREQASPDSGLCVCGDGLIPGGIPGVIQDVFEQIDLRVG